MQTTIDVKITKTTSTPVASCSIASNEEVQYNIYNSDSKLVFSKSIILVNTNGNIQEDLNLSHLPTGNYTLEISTSGNHSLKKINITI